VEQRRLAPALYRIISLAATAVAAGTEPALAAAQAREELQQAGFDQVDYVGVHEAETLKPASRAVGQLRVLAAAWLGKTRLIDNVRV
jgi:pantoate--beta-alanine ligase